MQINKIPRIFNDRILNAFCANCARKTVAVKGNLLYNKRCDDISALVFSLFMASGMPYMRI